MLSSNCVGMKKIAGVYSQNPPEGSANKSRFLSSLHRLFIISRRRTVQNWRGESFSGKEFIFGLQCSCRPKTWTFPPEKIASQLESGATAKLPWSRSLANQGAGQVTMIQRSPTYGMKSSHRNWTVFFLKKSFTNVGRYRPDPEVRIFLLLWPPLEFSKSFPEIHEKALIMKCGSQTAVQKEPVDKPL